MYQNGKKKKKKEQQPLYTLNGQYNDMTISLFNCRNVEPINNRFKKKGNTYNFFLYSQSKEIIIVDA